MHFVYLTFLCLQLEWSESDYAYICVNVDPGGDRAKKFYVGRAGGGGREGGIVKKVVGGGGGGGGELVHVFDIELSLQTFPSLARKLCVS